MGISSDNDRTFLARCTFSALYNITLFSVNNTDIATETYVVIYIRPLSSRLLYIIGPRLVLLHAIEASLVLIHAIEASLRQNVLHSLVCCRRSFSLRFTFF